MCTQDEDLLERIKECTISYSKEIITNFEGGGLPHGAWAMA